MGNRQKYPRKDSTRRFKMNETSDASNNPPKMCDARGCAKPATAFTFIQFTYMRGEDEGVKHCDDHQLERGHDPKAVSTWCKQFPTEAWK